jgi:hypothetical protein
MKNLKYFILELYSTGSSAQLKAVAYKDGSQVLNGFNCTNKKSKQKPGILILPAWHGIDKASRILQVIGCSRILLLHSGYGEGITRTMQKLAKI